MGASRRPGGPPSAFYPAAYSTAFSEAFFWRGAIGKGGGLTGGRSEPFQQALQIFDFFFGSLARREASAQLFQNVPCAIGV